MASVFDKNVFRSNVFDMEADPATPRPPSGGSTLGAVRTRTLRQMCIEADPDFYTEGRKPIAYEFGGGRRRFREITDQSGPYSGS